MKKYISLFLFAFLLGSSIFLNSCSKDKIKCDEPRKVKVTEQEITELKNYLAAKNIKAEYDERGFYYKIAQSGNSNHPTACSNLTVNYIGNLTNGSTFDSNQNITFNLSGLIMGWQYALPLIGEEGSIVLYLPPSLGYGIKGNASIPSNAITIFTIQVLKVHN